MSKSSLLDQEKFWNVIRYLVELEREKSFDDICFDLKITKKQLNSFINFLKEVNCHLELNQNESNTKLLKPAQNLPKVSVEFNLLEWLQFQAHFPTMSQLQDKPFHEDIKKKLIQVEYENSNSDLFGPLETFEKLYERKHLSLITAAGETQGVLETIESSCVENKTLSIGLNHKTIEVYPRKIVFFDGDFNLIGECIEDQSLINISITSIHDINITDSEWNPKFSKIEINDFISSLREMNDTNVRLVLKIFDHQKFNLNLPYQFFESPCVFTNSEGDYIWAATIEPNSKIFQWLFDLGSDVEILDPKHFKLDFLNYCENKLKKLA